MFSLPCEGIDLFSKLAKEDVFGGFSDKQHNVHVSWPQLYQVAHVGDISQLCYLHKILPWRPTTKQQQE